MAQWRTVSSRRIHRDQSKPSRQTGGAVLQPAWHGGTVDQGGQECGQMDPPVLSRLCGQPSAVATVRAGLQHGQLPAAGGAAQSGSSLEFDDIAGEIDQDRGEGRAPFPEDSLPDGGGGGPAKVVSGHSRRDWAAEIGNRDVRMKEETQQSHENNARKRCLRIREKMGVGSKKWHRNSPVPENNRNGLEKVLANRRNRKIITKKAHAGRGLETIWEIPG